GVLAIINERAAVEKRLQAAWGGRLELLGSQLLVELSRARVEPLPEGLIVTSEQGRRLSREPFLVRDGEVHTGDARLQRVVHSVLGELRTTTSLPAFSVSGPQGTYLLRTAEGPEGQLLGARLDEVELEALLSSAAGRILPAGERARFGLFPV